MRAVAAVPAVTLLAGSAFGLLLPGCPRLPEYAVLLAGSIGALRAWRAGRSRQIASWAAVAFAAGGALLAADAWRQAWQPDLRDVFADMARAERAAAVAEGRTLPDDDSAWAMVTGVLRADAAETLSGVSLSLDVETVASSVMRGAARAVDGGLLATVVGELAVDRVDEWRAGRRVRLPVTLRRPSRYLDPGVPDFERALARRGTNLVGTVKSGALVEVIARGSRVSETIGAARLRARHAIHDAVGRWSDRSAAIVAAIVIGDRVGLDPDVQRRLQEAGTYHVIAISGGNIAILVGLLLGAFRFAGLLGPAAMVAAIAALLAYADFVGGGASVDRATLMGVVYLAARAIDHRGAPLNVLAIVAAGLVAASPLSVFDPAFVLTFGATLAIVVAVPVAAEFAGDHLRGRAWFRLARPGLSLFAASIATELMLVPVSAVVFSRVTVAGLALNFLAIPLMAVAQIAGMAVVPVALVSPSLARLVGFVAHLGAAGLVRSADLVELAPRATWRVAPPAWWVVGSYYTALVTWWVLRRRRASLGTAESTVAHCCRWSAAVAAGLGLLWIVAEPWTLPLAHGDGRLHVTFADVGQGDATWVRFPRGSTMLVDAGGLLSTFDVGDRVVAPVLRNGGVRRLDYLVLTHGDPDHIGGVPAIVREFRPREVWEGVPVPTHADMTAIRAAAEGQRARWSRVTSGRRVLVDGVAVCVQHPPPADWERQRVRNDDSVVLELRWGEVSVLLTADIGVAAERAVAGALTPAAIRVLKVPHHGSTTSSSVLFLRAAAPSLAVVSVGRANHFGHPAPIVLDRYRDAGIPVLRTDRLGAITLDTDGRTLDVHTFTDERLGLSPGQQTTKAPRTRSE